MGLWCGLRSVSRIFPLNCTEICQSPADGTLSADQALNINLPGFLLERYLRYYNTLTRCSLGSEGFHGSGICPITLMIVVLYFRIGNHTSPVWRVAATHLKMELLEICWIVWSGHDILILSALSLVIKRNLLLAWGWWTIGIVVYILRWLHHHSLDHLLLLCVIQHLWMTLSLIRVCAPRIRRIHQHGPRSESLRLLLNQVGIELLF